jgi:hypothetical protein
VCNNVKIHMEQDEPIVLVYEMPGLGTVRFFVYPRDDRINELDGKQYIETIEEGHWCEIEEEMKDFLEPPEKKQRIIISHNNEK